MDGDLANKISVPDYEASQWLQAGEFPMDQVPAGLRHWLDSGGMLTRRLKKCCGPGFRLHLLEQRPATANELNGGGLCREVSLECGPLRAIFARSLIPSITLAICPWLADLAENPLGETLAEKPDMKRSGFSFAIVRPGQPLYTAALPPGAETPPLLYTRRSEFRLDDHPLWVCEVFLPAICLCQENRG
ncbi:MAG: chorismate lyase [Gammaproteobacteria bacterium]|nr:chorismate lyase [Gammaproteobacteria bacterium]MCZ6716674.1 chorismate lyase [Gammaproteobacteria bacterium]MCZ6826835.1 chorismate lyase [Gammaproteobacteria bacterium]MCZ6911596.1 chorismate lyase [Pseudomonadota bacterium]